MHPSDEASIDALYFSPHKFLGGQGTPGVVVFNKELYGHRQAPVRPGGGTVVWTNPWGGRRYHGFDTTSGIEAREDGGTPPFMGAIRAAKAIQLKEEMGMGNIASREAEITSQVFADLENTDGIRILGGEQHDRLPVFALVLRGLHYNAVTTLLSDRFGIQARGGCSCAGTYGHELLNIGPAQSQRITDRLDDGDMTLKPGYTRISLHPTMPSAQVGYITHALATVVVEGREWIGDYSFDSRTGEFTPRNSFIGK
jgi:selenocysteine lyase/cysteine desulfurase